jgi:pimeloyl-ACP methyl ester carboxylesterase
VKALRLFFILITCGLVVGLPPAFAAITDSASDAATLTSHFAKFETNKVHYAVTGRGRHTVVFVHGWGGNTGFWRDQVPALENRAKLILVDLPGHGQSDKPQTEYTMDFFARGVIAVLRDAKVQRATLVGHSMGTPVIRRVYALAPEKVAGLVAVDGLLRRPKGTPEQFEAFVAPYRTEQYREHTTQFIAAMFPNPGTEKLRDWTLAQVLATPQHVLSGAMDGMFKQDQPAWDLGQVTIPVMAINAKSPMWTSEYEAYVRGLSPKTDYVVIEGAGHFLMREKPAEFNKALVALLQKFDLIDQLDR